MANEHPFQMLFETLGRLPIAHAESVNRQAYEILYDILSVAVEKPGRCILLRAPRAGHGKTHLLSRIQHHMGASHEFIPLHATFGSQIDAASVIDDAMRRLLRPLPASGGLCVLDLVTRRLFASALQPLVGSGEVPCQDREGALTALRTRPIETFDFHHPNAVTAHWARENFEVLGQRLSVELAQRSALPVREVAFWVDALFHFAATPVENPVRLQVLADVVHSGNPGDGVLMERLEALLGLLSQLMRVVLVADDLEGFSTDESAALRLAAFLGSLRQSVERLDVILSLNQDIWQSAFVPRLSGGLADRLSEVVVELEPLTEEEMVALLESRVPGLGARVFARVDRGSAGNHARGLIRAAGIAWLRASAMDNQAVAAPVIAPVSQVAAPIQPPVAIGAEAPHFEPVPESPSIACPVEPSPEIPEIAPQPAPVPVERAPDPTLAIAFLAAQGGIPAPENSSWPSPDLVSSPGFSAADVVPDSAASAESPFQAEGSPEPVFEAAVMPEVFPEPPAPVPVFEAAAPPMWNPSVDSPFQASPELETPVFVPNEPPSVEQAFPAYGSSPSGGFQPVSEFSPAPPFQPVPDFNPAPSFEAVPEPPVAFQPAPQPDPVFQAAPEMETSPFTQSEPTPELQAPAQADGTPAPDTDRVDDLLRQFRERYGRGSM